MLLLTVIQIWNKNLKFQLNRVVYLCLRNICTKFQVETSFLFWVLLNNLTSICSIWQRPCNHSTNIFIHIFLLHRIHWSTKQIEIKYLAQGHKHAGRSWARTTDLNTWIAGSHGFAYSSMRATGNTSAAILLQSKHVIDTLTSTHISAWNATGDRFLASNFMKILRKKMKKFHRSSRLLNIYWKLLKNLLM